MIWVEDQFAKLNGVLLPGAVKSVELTQTAAIDEVEVEGSAVKPKQAVGYEDAKLKLELIVDAVPGQTIDSKIEKLNNLFRKKGQEVPQPMELVCKQTASAGIGKVLFEKLTTKRTNKSDQYAVTLEFCQYIPVPIAVTTSTGAASAASGGTGGNAALSADYQSYLDSSRGTAPRIGSKLAASPSIDDVAANLSLVAEMGKQMVG